MDFVDVFEDVVVVFVGLLFFFDLVAGAGEGTGEIEAEDAEAAGADGWWSVNKGDAGDEGDDGDSRTKC